MSEKKMVKRSVAIALGIICIVLIASMVTVVTLLSRNVSELTQKYDKENTLANVWENVWENPETIPNNINDLFQNKVILWDDRNVTEPYGPFAGYPSSVNFTLGYNFYQTGCLLINISSSTVGVLGNWVGVSWSSGPIVSFDGSVMHTSVGLFPILNTNSVLIYIGNFDSGNGNVTQTVTLTYFY